MVAVILIALLFVATLLCAAWTLHSLFTKSRKSSTMGFTVLLLLTASTTTLILHHVGLFGENFSAVSEHECYRSSQLSAESLRRIVQETGIRTVINLRGESKRAWYRSESAVLRELNVSLLNIGLSNQHIPHPERMAQLINALKTAPRPILLHCNHGVDRTGFAAVLFKSIVKDCPLKQALLEENSLFTGHFITRNNDAGDRVFDLYKQSASTLPLEQWSLTTYSALYPTAGTKLGRTGSSESWLNAPLRIGGLSLTPFKALGILGASLFACRWFVQAYYSRRAGRPVTPLNFWLISILGSALMLLYFCFSPKQDIVGIISNLFPAVVSAYNVFLELRHRERQRRALELPPPAAKLQSCG